MPVSAGAASGGQAAVRLRGHRASTAAPAAASLSVRERDAAEVSEWISILQRTFRISTTGCGRPLFPTFIPSLPPLSFQPNEGQDEEEAWREVSRILRFLRWCSVLEFSEAHLLCNAALSSKRPRHQEMQRWQQPGGCFLLSYKNAVGKPQELAGVVKRHP